MIDSDFEDAKAVMIALLAVPVGVFVGIAAYCLTRMFL